MSKLIVGILIYPCISVATIDPVGRLTDLEMCANTVKIEERSMPAEFDYAKYQHNFFRSQRLRAKK
jgi:hypothetical protein